jgi:hypothetical protein
VQRSAAAVRDERELARIFAALHGDDAQHFSHRVVDQRYDARGRRFHA